MGALTSPLQATTGVSPASSTRGSGQSAGKFNAFNEQDFMKLLTAQLKHQDPTSPMKEQQLASEMAQFSTATGINTLNNHTSTLISGQKAGALAKASGLIGKQVMTSGNALVSDNNGHAKGAFTLSKAASNAAVHVINGNGKEVGKVNLGSLSAGVHTFSWDSGKPNTAYRYVVEASNSQGQAVSATSSSLYTVKGVSQSGNSVSLTLADNPNPLALSQVQKVL